MREKLLNLVNILEVRVNKRFEHNKLSALEIKIFKCLKKLSKEELETFLTTVVFYEPSFQSYYFDFNNTSTKLKRKLKSISGEHQFFNDGVIDLIKIKYGDKLIVRKVPHKSEGLQALIRDNLNF